jgi:arsenite-transporting ATPase
MKRARRPLMELFDRGTYLDEVDAGGFLDLTLPGVDEIAGMLRLAELHRDRWERVVVDTAPTGHALRLLDAGEVVASWSDAFDAMAEKASAVIGALTRRPVRMEADALIDELRARVDDFRAEVLEVGCAVLVEREGTVVEAESQRLARALDERGLRVALRVRVAAGHAGGRVSQRVPLEVTVPFRPALQGCDGLRRWGEPAAAPGRPGAATAAGGADALLPGLPPLLLFVGKGGVGKSTCAAAAALALAEAHDVLLLGADPAGSLGDVLGMPLGNGEARVGKRLVVKQIRATEEFEALALRYRESIEHAFRALGLEGAAALDRRVLESLLGLAPPGIDELVAVAELLDERGEGRRVVVDAAPTGHFLRLLAMPEVALQWTRQLLRVIQKYRSVLGLDAFAERLLDFAKRLKELNLTLSDPDRSAAIVVTQPGPLVAAESGRLLARLEAAGVRVAAVIANRHPLGGAPPSRPAEAALITAPLLEEPPVGATALRAFLASWSVAR